MSFSRHVLLQLLTLKTRVTIGFFFTSQMLVNAKWTSLKLSLGARSTNKPRSLSKCFSCVVLPKKPRPQSPKSCDIFSCRGHGAAHQHRAEQNISSLYHTTTLIIAHTLTQIHWYTHTGTLI